MLWYNFNFITQHYDNPASNFWTFTDHHLHFYFQIHTDFDHAMDSIFGMFARKNYSINFLLFIFHKNLPEFHQQNCCYQFYDQKGHLVCCHLNHHVDNSIANQTVHLECCHHIDISVVSSRYHLTKLYQIWFPFLVRCAFFHYLRLCLWILVICDIRTSKIIIWHISIA